MATKKPKVDWQAILALVLEYIKANDANNVPAKKEVVRKIREAQNG